MTNSTYFIVLAVLIVLASTVVIIGYRIGGSKGLWISALGTLVALETLAVWDRNRGSDEGPLWLTIFGGVVIVGAIASTVYVTSSRNMHAALQVLLSSIAGLVSFFVVGFVGYLTWVYLF